MHLALLLSFAWLPASPAVTAHEPVNRIIGDEGFIAEHGRAPGAQDPEVERIQAHLRHVIARLRAETEGLRSLDQTILARRVALIDALEVYAERGVFPTNHVDPGRTPVFIDPYGVLCAVAHLVAEASGRALAEELAARHRYDYILDMNDPALESWAAEHGFSLHELAMIQPTYGWMDPPGEPIIILPPGEPIVLLPELPLELIPEPEVAPSPRVGWVPLPGLWELIEAIFGPWGPGAHGRQGTCPC